MNNLEKIIESALQNAINHKSKLINDILQIKGMTSTKTRHFYNNVLASLPENSCYLEIGCWKGSSIISALFNNNHINAVCIDNWSEFEGPKSTFVENKNRFIPDSKLTFYDQDCFSLTLDQKFDVYMYDGGHSLKDHTKAITHFWDNLKDEAIIIIDDWNWTQVQQGTRLGFTEVNANIVYEKEIFTSGNGDLSSFWNGMAVFVINKE